MASTTPSVFKIIPGLQSYAWGKKGSSSLAAQLGTTSIPDFTIDDEKPYAEVRSSHLMHAHYAVKPMIAGSITNSPSRFHETELIRSYGWEPTQTFLPNSNPPPPQP